MSDQVNNTRDQQHIQSQIVTAPKSKKILVVEDDQTQWPLWEEILKEIEGPKDIDWETSGERAEALLKYAYQKHEPYDLVISDIFLDGKETGIELWNKYGETADNFIFVSGVGMDKYEFLMSLDYGYPVFMKKPVPIRECKETIKSICNE